MGDDGAPKTRPVAVGPNPLTSRAFLRTSAMSVGGITLASTVLAGCEAPQAPERGPPRVPHSPWPALRRGLGRRPRTLHPRARHRVHEQRQPRHAASRRSRRGRRRVQSDLGGAASRKARPAGRDRPARHARPRFDVQCRCERASLTRHATEALQPQTIGLALEPGDEVIITTQEHPAGHKPWMYRAAHDGVRLREVFIPGPFTAAPKRSWPFSTRRSPPVRRRSRSVT